MSIARTTVRVHEEIAVRQHAFVRDSGAACGWLDVGEDGELGVHGFADALRRLAAALLIAADAADQLVAGRERPAVAVRAA